MSLVFSQMLSAGWSRPDITDIAIVIAPPLSIDTRLPTNMLTSAPAHIRRVYMGGTTALPPLKYYLTYLHNLITDLLIYLPTTSSCTPIGIAIDIYILISMGIAQQQHCRPHQQRGKTAPISRRQKAVQSPSGGTASPPCSGPRTDSTSKRSVDLKWTALKVIRKLDYLTTRIAPFRQCTLILVRLWCYIILLT